MNNANLVIILRDKNTNKKKQLIRINIIIIINLAILKKIIRIWANGFLSLQSNKIYKIKYKLLLQITILA